MTAIEQARFDKLYNLPIKTLKSLRVSLTSETAEVNAYE
jgi:hypothetical protein